jgi:hypothetical protein
MLKFSRLTLTRGGITSSRLSLRNSRQLSSCWTASETTRASGKLGRSAAPKEHLPFGLPKYATDFQLSTSSQWVLERARLRCREFINVSFSKWDLKSDPAPGAFDLIVIMDVFCCLSARDIRRAREKLVNALAPGGYLLLGDCLGELNRRRIQDSWLGALAAARPSQYPSVCRRSLSADRSGAAGNADASARAIPQAFCS